MAKPNNSYIHIKGEHTIFYDGACSICRRKMRWLQSKDKLARLTFIDIAADGFSPPQVCSSLGITHIQLNTSLHLFKPDGSYVKDLDAIHLAYKAIGLGWITAPVRIVGLRQLTDYLFYKWKRHIRGIKTYDNL